VRHCSPTGMTTVTLLPGVAVAGMCIARFPDLRWRHPLEIRKPRATFYAMSRVRISTTVDGERLAACRRILETSDSKIVDRALAALVEELEERQELDALEAQPYHDDPDLAWQPPQGPDLPYDGDVPADVARLAARRRARR